MIVLIAFPGELVKKLYQSSEKIIFFDNYGWSVLINGKRETLPLDFNLKDLSFKIDAAKLRVELNWWSPMWARWIPKAHSYINFKDQSILIISKIIFGLKKYNISKVIFHTGIPHHLDTSFLLMACSQLNIDSTFLYANVFNHRLMPTVHKNSILDRKIIDFDISNYDSFELTIDDFTKNKLKGNAPNTSTAVIHERHKSLWRSVFYISKLSFLKKLSKIKSLIIKKPHDWTKFFPTRNFKDLLEVLNIQRKFIRALKKEQLSLDKSISFLKSKPNKIVIAAHFQPEATTFPEGGNYSNHLDIIIKIRSLGFKGEIAYKEHPGSFLYGCDFLGVTGVGICRSLSYLNNLKELGCTFLHNNTPIPVDLNNNNFIVCTITGTIAIERSLVGLKTLVFGEPWFKGLPGTIHQSNIESINIVDENWVESDLNIARESREFLLEKLNNKTITNCPGIGTGVISDNEVQINQFKEEFSKLLTNIA